MSELRDPEYRIGLARTFIDRSLSELPGSGTPDKVGALIHCYLGAVDLLLQGNVDGLTGLYDNYEIICKMLG